MKTLHVLTLAFLLILLVAPVAEGAESISVLLQKGIYAEETEGNLETAIKIYDSIVQESDASRSLAAQAQYRLAMCRLKQGKREEATAAFRKLVDRFSEAAELMGKAREQLAELGEPVAAVVVRQVWARADGAVDRISQDGRYLTWVDRNTGNLMMRDLVSSQNRQITKNASWTEPVQFSQSCAFSRDGKQLAYDWQRVEGSAHSSCGLYVMDLQNGTARTLIDQQTNRWFVGAVGDWTPDGQSVVVFEYERVGTNWVGGMSLIEVASGQTHRIAHHVLRGNWSAPSTIRFSPDGRYLSYNLARDSGRLTNDIYVLELSAGITHQVVEHLANEKFIGWAPRGSEILFTSERGGALGLWSIDIKNGEAKQRPKLVRSHLRAIDPIGVSKDGAFYYRSEVGTSTDLYSAAVDFDAAKVISAPKLVQTIFKPPGMPSNKFVSSAGGERLFFCSGEKQTTAHILNTATLEVRELVHSGGWASKIAWWWPSLDGAWLLAALHLEANEGGFYRVNTETGAIIPLALHGPDVEQDISYNPIRLRFDENFVAYGRRYTKERKLVLVKHDLKLGRETEHEIPGMPTDRLPGSSQRNWINRHVLLPDGRTFVFNRKSATGDLYALVRHDLTTGKQEEIFTSKSLVGIIEGHTDRIFIVIQDERGRSVFKLFSLENSAMRASGEVTVPAEFEYRGQNWNGPHLILVRKEDVKAAGNTVALNTGTLVERWTLSLRTGELKRTGFSAPQSQFLGRPAASGAKPFVFPVTRPAPDEIWVMENMLP